MRSRATVILALLLLAAGCGEGLGEGESTTRPPVSTTAPRGCTSPEALFLIARETTFYAVADWDGREILDWSADGTSILTFDGTLQVIDLVDGTEFTVPADLAAGSDARSDARFSPTGDHMLVRTLSWERPVR